MTQSASCIPINKAKLIRPRLAANLVARPRLWEILNRQRPLTVVIAPAGYGKTTLLASWAEVSNLSVTWLSLDKSDDQLGVFIGCFVAALREFLPEPQRILAALASSSPLDCDAIAALLANQLDAGSRSFFLVIDDYHLISDAAIHRFLELLLQHPPHTLCLVLASRRDPPLPLATMRARNQLGELRARDLRFQGAETATFIATALETSIDAATVAELEAKTEGWIVGLRLAALYLRTQPDVVKAIHEFQGNNRQIMDYLAAEVLAQQPPKLQAFLLRTSILDRMCADLCDVVIDRQPGDAPSQAYLDQLEADNLFMLTLDDGERWCSYHPLFQRLLQHRLHQTYGREEIVRLHAAAWRWFAAHGSVDDAIVHALVAGQIADATALIEEHRQAVMAHGQWATLEKWLRPLPRHAIDASPELSLLEAWVLYTRNQSAANRLDLAEALLDERSGGPNGKAIALRSEIAALRSREAYMLAGDVEAAHRCAQQALASAPFHYALPRATAWVFLAGSVHVLESTAAARGVIDQALAEDGLAGNAFATLVRTGRALIEWSAADLSRLLAAAEEMILVGSQRDLPQCCAWGRYFRGCAHYQQDNLAAAQADFAAVLDLHYSAPAFAYLQSLFGQAAVFQAQGDFDAAYAVLDLITIYAQETGDPSHRPAAQAFRAWLDLHGGRTAEALQWVGGLAASFVRMPLIGFFEPAPVFVQVLLCHGGPASIAEAALQVAQLCDYTQASHNTLYRIQALLLKTILHARRAEQGNALAVLAEAVRLAAPAGVVRIFVDLCPRLQPLLAALLEQLAASGLEPDFIAQVQRAQRSYPIQTLAPTPGGSPARLLPAEPLTQPRSPDLIEPLTKRELEVLQLLAMRLTNKEIAHELHISTETAKQHSINIFRKLNADNRRDAVLRARTLGFALSGPGLPRRNHDGSGA